jgi:hypothetical protein
MQGSAPVETAAKRPYRRERVQFLHAPVPLASSDFSEIDQRIPGMLKPGGLKASGYHRAITDALVAGNLQVSGR